MKKENIDGSVFLYDPTNDKDIERLIESHPDFQADLGDLKSYKKRLLKFIILQYDMNTPLRLEYKNYFKRKGNAALLAGFKRNKSTGKFNENVVNALLGKNDVFNSMIVRYVMQFYNEDYLNLIIYYELLGKIGREGLGDVKLSNTNIQAINNIKDTISELTKELFGGDETRELKGELYKALEMEKESLHPDFIAMELHEGKKPFLDDGK